MKVVILQGSPRRSGNTDTICQHMAVTMKDAGAQVETIRLADLDIGGCTECFACQKVEHQHGCPLKDEMHVVYDAVLASDALLLATPVFCWGPAAQLKAPLDRFYAFCKFNYEEAGKFKCLVEEKRSALVVTAGGGPYDGAEICVAGYRAVVEFMRMENRGEFVAAPVGEPDTVKADKPLLARAGEFARKILA